MIKSTVEKMANPIGFEIGTSDDIVQSDLLNGFCKGLSNSMQPSDLSMQICHIVEKLDYNSMKVISEISEFIKLKQINS